MTLAKILLLDIETAPNLSWVWAKYEQNSLDVHTHWYILTYAWKWLDDKKVQTRALPDYARFKRHRHCDRDLCKDLWKLLDEADIVVAHNGDRFDIPKINARFLTHGFRPYSPIKSHDTLKVARKHFKFDSNKLDDLGAVLKVGRKMKHTGVHLWLGCYAGKRSAFKQMRAYNARDVELLERVHLKLRPWSTTHPNLSHLSRNPVACPACESTKTESKGFKHYSTGRKRRRVCHDCGRYFVYGKHEPLERV